MKPNKLKKPSAQDISRRVDALGASYEEALALVDQGNVASRGCKEEAQSLAENCGLASVSGKGKYVFGEQFVAGYYDRAGATRFDTDAFAKAHPDLYAKCVAMVQIFDENLFIALVKAKKIRPGIVKKFTLHGNSNRITYIKRKTEKQ